MTQHLIPTTITDRNGRITTVYRSSTNVTNPSKKGIPVPSAAVTTNAKTVRASIAYNVASINIYKPATTKEQDVVDSLETMDMDLLRALHTSVIRLTEIQKDNPALRVGSSFRDLLERNDREGIDIAINHGHKTSGSISLQETVLVAQKLRSMDDDQTSFTDNLDAHLDAAGKLTYLSGSGNPDFYYYEKEPLIRFINKHPDRVDDILQFRLERALEVFSEDDFQEWLSAGVLRDGFL